MKLFIFLMMLCSLSAFAAEKFPEGSKFTYKKSLASTTCGGGISFYIVEGAVKCSSPLLGRSCLVTGVVSKGQNCRLSSSVVNTGLRMRDMEFSPSVTCPSITCSNNAWNSLVPGGLGGGDSLTTAEMKKMLGDLVSIDESDESDEFVLPASVNTGRRYNSKAEFDRELEGNGIIPPRRRRAILR